MTKIPQSVFQKYNEMKERWKKEGKGESDMKALPILLAADLILQAIERQTLYIKDRTK